MLVRGTLLAPRREADDAAEGVEPVRTGTPVLTFIGFLLAVAALWCAQVILIPLVLGIFGSYALDPLQRRLVRWRVPSAIAAALILIALVGGVLATGYALRTQTAAFVARLPAAAQQVRSLLRSPDGSPSPVVQVQQAAHELTRDESSPTGRDIAVVQVAQPELRVSQLLWWGSVGVAGAIGQATLVLFFLNQISDQVGRFLVARLIVSGIVGVATGIAFRALGVAQPALWGVGAGILNAIPYIAPCAVAAAAAIAGLTQFGTGSMAAVLGLTALGIAALEGSFVTPWIMGRAGRMNPGAVFIGLSFWGWLWGIWGLLLAVPMMMAVKAVCDHVDGWSSVSELLSD